MDKTNWHRPNEEMHGKQTSCPKCELEFKTMLHPFCQHHECPVRDWEDAQKPPKPADTRPSLVERLRTEADLCRNETADDVAALLDEAADEIQRHNYCSAAKNDIATPPNPAPKPHHNAE